MGAGASASDQEELRAAFSEFSPSMSVEELRTVLERRAPLLLARIASQDSGGESSGSVAAAIAALHDQFQNAHRKLRTKNEDVDATGGPCNASSAKRGATEDEAEAAELTAARLMSLYDWAGSKEANLQRGLVESTLRTTKLRTVTFAVGTTGSDSQGGSDLNTAANLDLAALSIKELRAVISSAGLEHNDCLEKDDLRERARQAQQKLTSSAPSSSPSLSSSSSPSQWVVAMVDSGAERSAMSPAAAKRVGLMHLLDDSFARQVSGVGSARGHGRVHYAEVRLQNAQSVNRSHQAVGVEGASVEQAGLTNTPSGQEVLLGAAFDVFDWPSSASDFEAILGLDFLLRHHAILDFAGGSMTLALPRAGKEGGVEESDGVLLVPLFSGSEHEAGEA